jgi:SAM-dependent methyltransferase
VGGGERRTAGTGPGQLTARRFRPDGQDDLAPSGTVARIRANLDALTTIRAIQRENRPATPDEQAILARWSGWGAAPEVFDPDRRAHAWARDELSRMLTPAELAAAARNTLNAHYTDAALVQAIWAGVQQLGFTGGRVLEPGCGSGNFIGFAPGGVRVTGIELEPVTAQIAAALYPDADIVSESFADFRERESTFDLAIGNVPFGSFALTDRLHNPGGHSIHNHFIIKALHLVRPGGLVAVVTSRYTMDARNPAARREIADLADLAGAVRLPSGAHQRAAGTGVVTDLLIFRRREPGREPDTTGWEQTRMADVDGVHVPVNEYFLDHPDSVLGELRAVNPKLRPVRHAISGLTWAFTGLAGWCSGYFKVSGIAAPMSWNACRWALVGSVSIEMVTWVPVYRTWLRVKVARCSSRPRKLR